MGKECCAPEVESTGEDWKKILKIALVLNLAMFFLETIGSQTSGSMSLQADALDFLGDAFNYGISLYVAGHALKHRAGVSLLKGLMMIGFGVYILFGTAQRIRNGVLPASPTMGVIGTLALIVNVSVAVMLYRFREGDSNMQSVWLCTRNDVIGNVMVIVAAVLVHFTQSGWSDWIAGVLLALLGLNSGFKIVKLARGELRLV
jgi:cation diffusion facilitator family transporter